MRRIFIASILLLISGAGCSVSADTTPPCPANLDGLILNGRGCIRHKEAEAAPALSP